MPREILEVYREFQISHGEWSAFEAVHPDYDPSPIHSFGPPGDDRFFYDDSLEDLKEQIDDWYLSNADDGMVPF